ncbi:MAG: hypothetical protein Q8Q15_01485 [bacterium]|nr:hypothetical protein [bacterium]
MSTQSEIIEDFLKVIGRDFSELGGSWPATAAQLKGYFHDLFYVSLYGKYQQDPGLFKKAISSLPITVLRIFLLRDSILAFKIARKYHDFRITNEEIIGFFLCVVKVLEDKTHSDPFSLKNESLILDDNQVNEVMSGEWFDERNIDERKEINSFSVTLQSYAWSVQYDVFAYGVYWHGPYLYSGNTFLLIKDLFDLNLPFWEKVGYSKARVCYLFSKRADITIDIVGNLNYKSNIWENLSKSKVLLDDREIHSIKEIQKLDQYFSNARKRQVEVVEKLKPLEIIKKGIAIYHYMFREFFKFYGEDWKPSAKIEERIDKLGFYYWDKFKESGQKMKRNQLKQFLTKLYDPRDDFTG